MKDYPDLYFKCNVLLLADVFEKCRNNNLEKHGLCPSHYLSAPALNQHTMLNMAKVGLELISDATYIYSLKKVWEAEFLTLR